MFNSLNPFSKNTDKYECANNKIYLDPQKEIEEISVTKKSKKFGLADVYWYEKNNKNDNLRFCTKYQGNEFENRIEKEKKIANNMEQIMEFVNTNYKDFAKNYFEKEYDKLYSTMRKKVQIFFTILLSEGFFNNTYDKESDKFVYTYDKDFLENWFHIIMRNIKLRLIAHNARTKRKLDKNENLGAFKIYSEYSDFTKLNDKEQNQYLKEIWEEFKNVFPEKKNRKFPDDLKQILEGKGEGEEVSSQQGPTGGKRHGRRSSKKRKASKKSRKSKSRKTRRKSRN